MTNDILNYRFLIPLNDEVHDWLNENFHDSYQSSDGSPVLSKHLEEGWLISKEQFKDIPSPILEDVLVYEINDRFLDVDDFIEAYWDGDVEDEDFII